METFIQSTSDLLEAFPGATVSITYSNVSKKTKSEDAKRASNVLKFKVYDSHSGKCIKYSTHKSKELSRLLTFLGPHGVSMKRKHDGGDVSEKKQKLGVGAASVMSNVKVEETEHETVESNAATPAPEEGSTATSSKKKKKKGKKK